MCKDRDCIKCLQQSHEDRIYLGVIEKFKPNTGIRLIYANFLDLIGKEFTATYAKNI